MNTTIQINPIGIIRKAKKEYFIEMHTKYRPGLENIEAFSHLQIIWWAHLTDNKATRGALTVHKLFKKVPDDLGVFGTRAPARPNPIMVSTIKVNHVDIVKGRIETPFIDAEDGTPLLDIKPYFPSERVKNCKVPEYFSHWPEWYEDAGGFDWKEEINI